TGNPLNSDHHAGAVRVVLAEVVVRVEVDGQQANAETGGGAVLVFALEGEVDGNLLAVHDQVVGEVEGGLLELDAAVGGDVQEAEAEGLAGVQADGLRRGLEQRSHLEGLGEEADAQVDGQGRTQPHARVVLDAEAEELDGADVL